MLGSHSDVQEKLYEEICETRKAAKGEITLETLKTMPFLDGIVFETLRLFPPVPLDGKWAAVDDVLPDGTVMKQGNFLTFEIA